MVEDGASPPLAWTFLQSATLSESGDKLFPLALQFMAVVLNIA